MISLSSSKLYPKVRCIHSSHTHNMKLHQRSSNPHYQLPILTQPIKPIKNTTITRKKSSNLDILRLMDCLNQPVPPDIYSSLIKQCTLSCDSVEALELHSRLTNQTGLRLSSHLIHRLLLMHVSCGQLDTACNLFDKMPLKKDFISWAIIIIGFLNNSHYEEAISWFFKMLLHLGIYSIMVEFPIWVIVVVCILKACVYTLNVGLGKQVHGLLLKLGGTDDFSINVSLMDFYGKFGCLESVNSVFNQLCHRSTAVWTAKIVNNCREGCFNEAMKDFKEMGKAGIRRNNFTFSSVLRACARMNDGGNCGKQVHAIAIKLGVESDAFVKCGLIDMYGKCWMVRDAERVFKMITDKTNTAYWNAMLMAYVKNGLFIEAVKFLYQMEAAGIQINKSLIDRVRIACGTKTLESRADLTR